jgi:hypothetical protein
MPSLKRVNANPTKQYILDNMDKPHLDDLIDLSDTVSSIFQNTLCVSARYLWFFPESSAA